MFRWAVIDCEGNVLAIYSAPLDYPRTKPQQRSVIVPDKTKWRPGTTIGEINGA